MYDTELQACKNILTNTDTYLQKTSKLPISGYRISKVKAELMIYIALLCNSRITAEPLYKHPLFIGPYAAANNTALLA